MPKGKYEACLDEQGDTYYKKVRRLESDGLTREKTIGAQGNRRANEAEFMKLADAMASQFDSMCNAPAATKTAVVVRGATTYAH